MDGPLTGIKVIELSRILAGPWAGQVLADLGAEVIKIEKPGSGDDTRKWGPPFIKSGDQGQDVNAAYYHCCNRGKFSLEADIKSPTGQRLVRELIAGADIVIENFKVGDLARFGLDYQSVSKSNRRLVFCSITGFGQDGPYANRPGYDFIIQGMSGIMSLTGEPGGKPQKMGVAFSDIFTGLYAGIGILAALFQARQTGRGCWIDMALLDCQVAVMANQAMNYLATGNIPMRLGNDHPNIAPYETIAVRDGDIILAVGNDRQFARLCDVLKHPEWSKDQRFVTNSARVINRKQLHGYLLGVLKEWSRADLLAKLEASEVPGAPILNLDETFKDPQVIHRGLKIEVSDADGKKIPSVANPIKFVGSPFNYRHASPNLGQHNQDYTLPDEDQD